MSPITKIMNAGVIILSVFFLHGCGSSTANPQASFNSGTSTSQHPAGWQTSGHMTAAQTDMTACTACHGSDYSGGISKVSCTQCHLGGVSSVHPVVWSQMTVTAHGSYVTANGNTSCSNAACHGPDLSGVAGSGPSCSSCHIGGTGSVHPPDWGTLTYYYHSLYVQANGTTTCATANCHGTDLTGVAGSGPSCTQCHLGGVNSVHPVEWTSDITLHKNYVANLGTGSCATAVCHGTSLQGVYLSGPTCAQCH
jgi:hypothetical protein